MMRKIVPIAVLSLILAPALSFAQNAPQGRESTALKRLGLNDTQVSQVLDIQNKSRDAVRKDAVNLRLVRDKIAQAMLPENPDMKAVNALVDQAAQIRADMQKTLLAAKVQLRQIMGDEAFRQYARGLRMAFGGGPRGRRPGQKGWRAPDRMGGGQL
jgi:hypothetical protein